jgi:malate synthase
MSSRSTLNHRGVRLQGYFDRVSSDILPPVALEFLADLSREFEARRRELLHLRSLRQFQIDNGEMPDFLATTSAIRELEWSVAPIPPDLLDRRVEITGPPDRKMVINALNSGANVFMADFEDANSPTGQNVLEGQRNLVDAVRRTISYIGPGSRNYELNQRTAVLFVRPRGWHLVEKHLLVNDQPISASLFDFGLYFFHNAAELLRRDSGPYFYLPKLESHLEARLWNDVFEYAQDRLAIPRGSIRATVLIETILAAFEMHEILWELRHHSAGLNCGRWDYIFSFIKKFRDHPECVLPNRAQITMDVGFLSGYVDLLIQTCHKREIHAMGGMAAQIPIKNDSAANERAIEKVRQDKLREVKAGHDGTWVAHPGLVDVAKRVFDEHLARPNQIDRKREDVHVSSKDLLAIPVGTCTRDGLRVNIDIGIQYLEAWLRGSGAVPIYNLMEDAATAEISRAQIWQWAKHGARLSDGSLVTPQLVQRTFEEEMAKMPERVGLESFAKGKFQLGAQIFEAMMLSEEFPEFLTIPAYKYLD